MGVVEVLPTRSQRAWGGGTEEEGELAEVGVLGGDDVAVRRQGRGRLPDIASAIEAIQSHLTKDDLYDGLTCEAVWVRGGDPSFRPPPGGAGTGSNG